MDEGTFEQQHASLFQQLRLQQGDCPDGEVLLRYVQGDVVNEEASVVKRHLELCSLCLGVIERLKEEEIHVSDGDWTRIRKQLHLQPAPWRQDRSQRWWSGWKVPTVAVAAVIVAVVASVLVQREPITNPDPFVRGNPMTLQGPSGNVDRLEAFRWSFTPVATSYRIEVRDGENTILNTVTPNTSYRPSQELMQRVRAGTPLRWRVQALNSAGQVAAESEWLEFTVAR